MNFELDSNGSEETIGNKSFLSCMDGIIVLQALTGPDLDLNSLISFTEIFTVDLL